MIVVPGTLALRPGHGRLFVVLGVFDGLHRGHLYLLDALRRAAEARTARPAVITFDHHPDEILTGSAPPLLLDPQERLDRLADAGVELTVVHHFDLATRRTPYDAFIRAIAERVDLAGFLMTPDSSFGYERGGTPATVATLGAELGYDVVVVPTLELDGKPVRSAEIRAAIERGDLRTAETLLGRPYAVVATVGTGGELAFDMPMALPTAGRHAVTTDAGDGEIEVEASGAARLIGPRTGSGRVRLVFR
ncbi:MAG: FAD synthetase family protein [Chloroflexi bacterium]|nr:FAD synthetase family protein [Chloroflexota bacterium]